MKKRFENVLPFNLQFFAEDNSIKDPDVNVNENGEEENPDEEDQGVNEKTFTQKEVNAMMAREKKQGKNSVLRSLGFKTEEEAKNAFNLLKTLTDSQKSEKEKKDEDNARGAKEKDEAVKRASEAENKLACFMAGVNKGSIEDVLAIASAKVDEDNDLSSVLEDMKKNEKYSIFFEDSSDVKKNGLSGTGSKPKNNKQKSDEPGSFGKRLAQNQNSSQKKKSSYF